eukprot:CAMPEP_0114516172 /NCGR_PEP_ID=MMETSP0109-20121206/17185_1 /TAXON_ID=29199 /ORGANISM="Chlorarachnion reptans, Strain CCCM449" /LENGTH=295 /DNA_ID=CAMNT_0001696541 /DNA_START=129 /DNA_END=1013 /DNA_ORIENTATION=+
MGDLVKVEPHALKMTLVPNQKIQGVLSIHNVSSKLVAYKVKTTRPERYAVGNNHGTIKPGSRGDVKIVVEAMKTLPEADVKDKFLVMYMALEKPPADVAHMWKEAEIMKKEGRGTRYEQMKIKCRLMLPVDGRAVNKNEKGKIDSQLAENYSNSTNPPPEYEGKKNSSYEPDSAAAETKGSSREEQSMMKELSERRQEYEELMTYTVKLATENEELKRELAQLKEGDGSLNETISDQKKRITDLQAQLESSRRNRSEANGGTAQATTKGTITFQYWEIAVIVVIIALVVDMLCDV